MISCHFVVKIGKEFGSCIFLSFPIKPYQHQDMPPSFLTYFAQLFVKCSAGVHFFLC